MSVNNDHENETKGLESEFINKLNISDKDSNLIAINCSYCIKPFNEELWCKKCDPLRIIEGWTSGNSDIDKFIKNTMYDAREGRNFLEWVPFDRFTDIKQIDEGGFAKVYTATWMDGCSYEKQDDGWKKLEPKAMKIVLKRLNGSQNISAEYLNEVNLILIFIYIYYFFYII